MAERCSIRASGELEFSPILLEPGEFLAPLVLVGQATGGAVRVKLYYDGATLFGANVESARPAFVNRLALSSGWTPLARPARIELGERVFVYDVEAVPVAPVAARSHWDAQTVLTDAALSAPAPPRDNPFRGQTAIWTVANAPPSLHSQVAVAALSSPPSRPPFEPPPVASAPSHDEAKPASPQAAAAPAPIAAGQRLWLRFLSELRATRPAIRWTLLALPAIAWLTLEPEPIRRSRRVQLGAERPAAAASAAPARAAEPAAGTAASTAAIAVPAGSSAAARVRPARAQGRAKRSLEAQAADAAARGAYAEAIALYQQLAVLEPERPEFASAARILRTR